MELAVRGVPGNQVDPLAAVVVLQDEVARASRPGWDHGRPSGLDAGLEETYYYEPPTVTWTSAVHLAVVDVDIETGRVTVERYIVAHDCGVVVNPMLVEGQIIGGAAQGLGGILLEEFTYDSEGQLLTGSLMDYLIPTALEVPHWETGYTVTPSPHHPIGAKGVGESATVGSPPAVVNAVVDALKPFGIRHADMPLTPSRVWDAMMGQPHPPI